MAKRVATIKGTFLRPAISKNRRVYNATNIGNAVKRMQESLVNGDLPITMATSHGAAADDDALSTIGRVTKVEMAPDGTATFEADIADTARGRDVANLVTAENPYIKGVSIRGAWMSEPYTTVADDGMEATTADDLQIMGIDFTGRPGVEGAQITAAEIAEAQADPMVIIESVEDAEVFTDEADKAPYGDVTYADPGYQKDGKKRYPIDNAKHVRAAWSYINQGGNGSAYTPAQLKRIKSKIKSAAKKFGIDINTESQQLTDELQEVLEAYASTCIDNGAGSINVSGYTDDAGKLAPLAARLAMTAIGALNIMDPDADGDIDLQMPDGSTDSSSSKVEAATSDDDMESAAAQQCGHCGADVPDPAMYCPMCGQPIAQAESQTTDTTESEESQVTTEVTPAAPAAAETAPAAPAAEVAEAVAPVTESAAPAAPVVDVDAIAGATAAAVAEALSGPLAAIAAALTPTEHASAPVAPVAPVEAAPTAIAPVAAPAAEVEPTFTKAELDARIAEATEAANAAAVESFRTSGGTRKGFVSGTQAAGVVEGGELDARKLAEMGSDEFYRTIAPVIEAQPFYGKLYARADAAFGA